MSENVFIIYPINLYEIEHLPKETDPTTYYLVEDPIFFGYREQKMNFNKGKLTLHRASMKYYYDYLKKHKKTVKYVDFKTVKTSSTTATATYDFLPKSMKKLSIYDPTDHLLLKRVESIAKKHHIKLHIHDTPNFLTPKEDLEEYVKNKKKFFHHHFYKWQKKRMDILKNTKSYDEENRKKLPESEKAKIPSLPENDEKTKYVKEAKKYINTNFPDNYGTTDAMIYPITHKSSEAWFSNFLKNRFQKFGEYQDAIAQGHPFIYHSVITPMLNIGLLDPQKIVQDLTKEYQKKSISINNYEGYMRQIIGWREYSRMLYLYQYDAIKNSNYFGNKRHLSKKWYDASTKILPIDDTIQSAFQYAYLHHILRLMMMSNFMNLCRLHPDDVYQWFMEFSADSYDWVMTNNVYSMGLYADGGLTMTRPYLSTSNYILKMSDYKKDGHWDKVWDTLYYYFLDQNYQKLRKTQMVRNLHIWDKKTSSEKAQIRKDAKKYIDDLTNKT